MRPPRSNLVPALAVLLSASLPASFAAEREPQPSAAEIEAFVGTKLPAGAHDIHVADEAGIDRLMRLRFDAPAAEADRFAAALVPGGLEPGVDPGMAVFGLGLDWWTEAPPPGTVGGEAVSAANRITKLVSIPSGPGTRRVWLAAFTQ